MPNSSSSAPSQADRVASQFEVNGAQLETICRHFLKQMRAGLNNDCAWQLPTYVTKLPVGTETGTFLAVDLGGTNCRVCAVTLHGDSTFDVTQLKRPVPAHLRVSSEYRPLFSFVAAILVDFLATLGPNGQARENDARFQLGFTFSFTCKQTSVAQGTLIHWDKGWDIPAAIGKDPCQMLQNAIDAIGLPISVCVLANDSVGTLMTRSYTSPGTCGATLAGVIFGTGTNAAYAEQLSNIGRLDRDPRTTPSQSASTDGIMIINTEWGCLDDNLEVLPRAAFDDSLDMASADPGSQMLEKRVSGMYLGELLRLALLQIHTNGGFDMTIPSDSPLFQPGALDSSSLSRLSDRDTVDYEDIIVETLGAESPSVRDMHAIHVVSFSIVRRAARLAGAALGALIIQSNRLTQRAGERQLNQTISIHDTTPGHLHKRRGSWAFNVRYYLRRIRCALLNSFSNKPVSESSSQCKEDNRDSGPMSSLEHEILDIGVDGSLIEFCKDFEAEMRLALVEIPGIGVKGERRIRIGLSKDGSGIGAALMAQAATALPRASRSAQR